MVGLVLYCLIRIDDFIVLVRVFLDVCDQLISVYDEARASTSVSSNDVIPESIHCTSNHSCAQGDRYAM